ncbi:MAG TPA: acetylornithine/succinylornithine family transaminase [Candidatus Aphodovivens excrementavium]|nr:acetylornithine/succinylornithine family transaminase [Candidatus Aphodovivens excrementavium]
MSLTQQKQLENEYVMHTFGRKPVELVRGSGMEVFDDEGRSYLDFIGGIGVLSLGHCHPAVVDALQKQTAKLMHVSNYYYIEDRGEVAQTVSDLLNDNAPAKDRSPWKSFFANSGAEANECAIKLVRLHARHRAAEAVRSTGADAAAVAAAEQAAPRLIVTLEGSFHGRTLASLAATAQPAKQESFQPLPGGFASIPLNDVAALEEVFSQRGSEICAVMVECIQGESGVHPCTKEFLQAARSLTEEHGALLVCDEVQCGVFRTGKPFGFQHYDIMPDVVTIAKGVADGFPMGMCAAHGAAAEAFAPGDHGSTFGGSCLAVAAARATLNTLAGGGFERRVQETGAYFAQRLAQLDHVTEVRGKGLMVAAELDDSVNANDVVLRALDEGFLLNATGPHTLRFLPPLMCETAHIDALIQCLMRLL